MNRRTLLAGIAGLTGLGATPQAQAASDSVGIAELILSGGGPSDLAHSRAGSLVTVRGYLAPSLDGRRFAFSENSPGTCQLCGTTHDPGVSLEVSLAAADPAAPVLEPVEISGRLALVGPSESNIEIQAARLRLL